MTPVGQAFRSWNIRERSCRVTVPRLRQAFCQICGELGRRGDLKEVTKLAEQKATTSVLYEETRVFEPSKDLVENSNVMAWMKKKGFKTEREMRAWTGQNYIAVLG